MSEDNPLNLTCWDDAGSWESCGALLLTPILPRLEAIRLAVRERLIFCGLDTSTVDTPVRILDPLSDTLGRLTDAIRTIPNANFADFSGNVISRISARYPADPENTAMWEMNNVSSDSSLFEWDGGCLSFQDGALTVRAFIQEYFGVSMLIIQRCRISCSILSDNTFWYARNLFLDSLAEWIWAAYQFLVRRSFPYFVMDLCFVNRALVWRKRACSRAVPEDGSNGFYTVSSGGRMVRTYCPVAAMPSLTEIWNRAEWIDSDSFTKSTAFTILTYGGIREESLSRTDTSVEYRAFAYFSRKIIRTYSENELFRPVSAGVDEYCAKPSRTANFNPEICPENSWVQTCEPTLLSDPEEWVSGPAFPTPDSPPSMPDAGWQMRCCRGDVSVTIPKTELFPFTF